MSIISPYGRGGVHGPELPPEVQRYQGTLVSSALVIAVLLGAALVLGIGAMALLKATAIGLFLGVLKQLPPVRRLSDDPIFTAFLGADWNYGTDTEAFVDISAAIVVGYTVGLAVLWATAGPAETAWFVTVMSGGEGGGGGDGFSLMAWILFILFCVLVGLVITFLTERVVLAAAMDANKASWPSKVGKKMIEAGIEAHATAAATRERPALIEPLIKGALHAALVGIILALIT